jgi:hypothetical protein
VAVDAVFISSVIGGFEEVREAAAAAVSASGLYPIRSEELSAVPASPQRALLDEVAGAEYYLLLVGSRYGEVAAGTTSPTEDEFQEASRFGKPILVLVQEAELESRQREFLERIRGGWGEGVFYGTFAGAGDVGPKVGAALTQLRSAVEENAPAARERALTLASEEHRSGWNLSVAVRVAFAPLRQTVLLDSLALEQPGLSDDVIAALRAGGSIPQSAGVIADVSSEGIHLGPPSQQSGPRAQVCSDGAILVSGSAASEDNFAGMRISPEALAGFLVSAGRSAQLIWERIDARAEVGQVAVATCIPDAQHLAYGGSGSSLSLAGTVPSMVIVPDPPQVIPRPQLDQEATARQLQAAIRRVFADAGRAGQ